MLSHRLSSLALKIIPFLFVTSTASGVIPSETDALARTSTELCDQIVSQGSGTAALYAQIEDMMDRASALTIGMDMARYQRLSDLNRLNFPLHPEPSTREILAWELYAVFIQANETGSDCSLAEFLDRLHTLNREIVAKMREQEPIYDFADLYGKARGAWSKITPLVQNDFTRWLGKVYVRETEQEDVLRQLMRTRTFTGVEDIERSHRALGRRILKMFGIGQSAT